MESNPAESIFNGPDYIFRFFLKQKLMKKNSPDAPPISRIWQRISHSGGHQLYPFAIFLNHVQKLFLIKVHTTFQLSIDQKLISFTSGCSSRSFGHQTLSAKWNMGKSKFFHLYWFYFTPWLSWIWMYQRHCQDYTIQWIYPITDITLHLILHFCSIQVSNSIFPF